MSWFLFIDESGQDRKQASYEVLAGVAIEDRDLWPLIQRLHQLEIACFGARFTHGLQEMKAQKLLKAKVFRLARQMPSIPASERTALAMNCLEKGRQSKIHGPSASVCPSRSELTALAQAKLAFVQEALDICQEYRLKAFASIVDKEAISSVAGEFLGKEYAYLFERYYYFLHDKNDAIGLIVFDELDKSQSHLLTEKMNRYFLSTTRGKERAGLIVPEPFFVHSHLTTAVQLADLVAYIISWGLRFGRLTRAGRKHLKPYADQVMRLQYQTTRFSQEDDRIYPIYGFKFLSDLRSRREKDDNEENYP